MANKTSRENAQQTFRQFAWHLAGTLSKSGKATPARPTGKR